MKIKKATGLFALLTLIILSISLVSFIKADDPVVEKILGQLNIWLTTNQPEKVYLQTDKPYYSAGDDIWFKAYLTVGSKHQLSALSGSLNVELIDEEDNVKQWLKLIVNNGLAWGDIRLSDTLHEGTYRLRAYTNWMRNAGPDYYFDKAITIGNAVTNSVFTAVSYSYAAGGKTTATVTYTNLNGEPYAGKPVNYRIQFGDKTIETGKGITNDKGGLIVDFSNPLSDVFYKGSIITNIKITDKNIVNKTVVVSAIAGKADVQFFPESGNLVNGVRSKVAFKAVGVNGLGADIKGIVTDNENKTISEFSSRHLGMGIFALTPESGKTYKAKITFADGSEKTINLPPALNSGYVLSINNTDADNIGLKVTGSSDAANTGVYIVAQSGGQVAYVAHNKAEGTSFSTVIPKSKFPSGVAQFTLFSATGEPLNERVAFIQRNDDILKLNISSKKTTAAREKVKIDVSALNNSGQPAVGSFSATVIDESRVQNNEDDETTILSHILLTSDLKGYIEQPGYYFNTGNETAQADLDILMLTQGYRRFEWKPLLAGTIAPTVYKPEKYITVSGNVKTPGGKIVPNAKVTLFSTAAESAFVLDTVADAQGNFVFKDLFIKDSLRFMVQARTAHNGDNVVVKLDPNGIRDINVRNISLSALNLNADKKLAGYLKANKEFYDEQLKAGIANHSILLQEVNIIEKKQNRASENSNNLNGRGNADQIITGDDLEKAGCISLMGCEILFKGIRIMRNHLLQEKAISFRNGGEMLVLLDGLPLEDISVLNLDVASINSIEILQSAGYLSVYGSQASHGVLIISSKTGKERRNMPRNNDSPGMASYSPKGYYRARTFYSPQYDDPQTNKALADLRSTIYWQPNVITDKSGHASFEYYNAGSPGSYRVVIEGIDADGNLGRQVYRYKVQ